MQKRPKKMKSAILIFTLIILDSYSWGQFRFGTGGSSQKSITINWVEDLPGDFSFRNDWSYPPGVEMKEDGRAGCADGGFCPERCYSMLDSNGIVLKDSVELFYQLLDTTHQFHSIQCEAWCYEWAGTDFMEASRKSKGGVFCYTTTGIATHCSLQMEIKKNSCRLVIELKSIEPGESGVFHCTGGSISIDRNMWENGIMKAEFSFTFENKKDPKKPFYWKGKVYAKIK